MRTPHDGQHREHHQPLWWRLPLAQWDDSQFAHHVLHTWGSICSMAPSCLCLYPPCHWTWKLWRQSHMFFLVSVWIICFVIFCAGTPSHKISSIGRQPRRQFIDFVYVHVEEDNIRQINWPLSIKSWLGGTSWCVSRSMGSSCPQPTRALPLWRSCWSPGWEGTCRFWATYSNQPCIKLENGRHQDKFRLHINFKQQLHIFRNISMSECHSCACLNKNIRLPYHISNLTYNLNSNHTYTLAKTKHKLYSRVQFELKLNINCTI